MLASKFVVIISVTIVLVRFTLPGHSVSRDGTLFALCTVLTGIGLGFGILGKETATRVLGWLMVLMYLLIKINRIHFKELDWGTSYEDISHIWCGVLIVLAILTPAKNVAWFSLVLISVIELVMFFVQNWGHLVDW